MSVFQKLPPFQNVAQNSTAVLPAIPMGMTYEAIFFKLGGTLTKALSTGIRVWLGGKKIVELTATQLDTINKYYQLPNDNAYLPLWFADIMANNPADYLAGAIDTSIRYSNFNIEWDIGAAATPTLEAYAYLSQPQASQDKTKGMIRALVKATHSPASAAEFDLPVPLGGSGALVRGVHYFHTNMTKLQVLKDNFPLIQEGLTATLQFAQGMYRTAQSGLISWDPIYKNDVRDTVPTLREDGTRAAFAHKVTVSGSDTVISVADILTTQAGL